MSKFFFFLLICAVDSCDTHAGVCIVEKSLQYARRRAYNGSVCHNTHAGVRIAASRQKM